MRAAANSCLGRPSPWWCVPSSLSSVLRRTLKTTAVPAGKKLRRLKHTAWYWSVLANQQKFFDEMAAALGITELSGWYKVSVNKVKLQGGGYLLNHYGSLADALKAVYPKYPWDSSAFQSAQNTERPPGRWKDPINQRRFLDELAIKLGIKEVTDWYKVTRTDILKHGGAPLFAHLSSASKPQHPEEDQTDHRDSERPLERLLRSVYPEHPWRFPAKTVPPPGYWSKANVTRALDAAERRMGITQPEDWYTVSLADLRQLGFPTSVGRLKLAELLAERYPDHNWDKVSLYSTRHAQQMRLERAVTKLFAGIELIRNARKEGGLYRSATGGYLELDMYIPSLNLAFEYQERHHYPAADHAYHDLEEYQQRDAEKRALSEEKGITLITVPFWWDGREESLVATIKAVRPDLLPNISVTAEAIPEDMPPQFAGQKNLFNVEDIGQPMTACFMTTTNVDPTNWWLFEKFDGVRGYWNPLKRAFYSRRGTKLPMPQDIVEAMPTDLFLDGELWFGRDSFQEALKISQRVPSSGDIDWTSFRYMVFDAPKHPGTYEQRYSHLERVIGDNPLLQKYVEVVPREVCKDMDHLERFFQDILDKGGEGVILRDPLSAYTPGRSAGFLKHKKYRDAEAKIVRSVGPHQWECELPNGVRFVAAPGSTQFTKHWDPQPGDIFSFKHHGFLLKSKKPKLAALSRMRSDLTWDEVVANWKENKPSLSVLPMRRPKQRQRPKGYWLETENRRRFLCDLAEDLGLDPYDAATWKKVTSAHVVAKKGSGLLRYYGWDLSAALADLFPGLGTGTKKKRPKGASQTAPKGYWADRSNQRKFLMEFAAEHGFDPLEAKNWKRITTQQILRSKGAGLLGRYKGSLKAAIVSVFPEFGEGGEGRKDEGGVASSSGAASATSRTRGAKYEKRRQLLSLLSAT